MGNAYLIGLSGQSGVSSWNDLENRPFGIETLDPLTWDGVTGSRTYITDSSSGALYVKISDKLLTADDFLGCSVSLSNGVTKTQSKASEIRNLGAGVAFESYVISVSQANVALDKVALTFPEPGTYFLRGIDGAYVQTLTFTNSRLTTIDEQFIPDTIARKTDVNTVHEEIAALDNRIGFNNPDPNTSLCQLIEETFVTKDEALSEEDIQDIRDDIQGVNDKLNAFENRLGVLPEDKTFTEAIVETYATKEELQAITAEDVGALTSAHNTASNAHNDIRTLIAGLSSRLNTLANSDDTTLDQLSEIVAYIKSNKELIDAITTSKVSIEDIINDLTTDDAAKPLSAAQGVALKAMIDEIVVSGLPEVTTDDNGKVLSVVNGEWVARSITVEGGDGALSTIEKEKLDSIETGAEVNVQADWNQTDDTQDDFIKNKPDILTEEDVVQLIKDNSEEGPVHPEDLAPVATSGSFNDLSHKPSVVLALNNEGVLCMNVIYSYDEDNTPAYVKEEDNEIGVSIEQATDVVANNNELEVN